MEDLFNLTAVISAGGMGNRLRPYTYIFPKPLLPIGEKPVLYYLMRHLYQCGFRRFYVSVHYLDKFFKMYFEDGTIIGQDVELQFIYENKPSGTIGLLRTIPNLPIDFLVVNGDRLTDFNFRDLIKHRREKNALVSIACGTERISIPYGTLKFNKNDTLLSFAEKPNQSFVVSRGAYAMHRSVLEFVPTGRSYGFDELVQNCLGRRKPVVCFMNENIWLDIGRLEDLQKAQQLFEDGSALFK